MQFFIYLVFYFVPFIAQEYETNPQIIIGLNYWCLLIQLVIGGFELIQMNVHGWKDYLQDPWNYIDVSGTTLQIIYFSIRVYYPQLSLPNRRTDVYRVEKNISIGPPIDEWIPLMNSMLMVFATFKIAYYLRAYSAFGLVVQLISVCVVNIFSFLIFMICWIFIFANLYMILGVDYINPDFESQNNLPHFLRVYLQTWKNSLGDSVAPSYVQWSKLE